MANPKLGKSREGQSMHYSVGALIRRGDKYLLIERVKPPYGFAGVAGHVDEGESSEKALVREVLEESGFRVVGYKLLFEEELNWNWCRRGTQVHYWYLYECEVEGDIRENIGETKSIGWFSRSEIEGLEIEPVWRYWFKKLKITGNGMDSMEKIDSGIKEFNKRTERQREIYSRLLKLAEEDGIKRTVFPIQDKKLFLEVLENFGPILDQEKAESNLMSIYEMGVHKETGALLISNKGATLFCLSPRTQTPYLSRHVGISVYMPGLGIEFVNVGLVGDVYDGPVVLRSESACSPSFLFGSQRCNCAHQWTSISELAAYFHRVIPPKVKNGKEFESWVQKQAAYSEGKCRFKNNNSNPGFILMHLDTQNGMGSGYTQGEFSYDLYNRASMRHRGEYSAEQIDKISMMGGFGAIGLNPDPRREEGNLGYKLTFIILDYLGISKDIIFLTNNLLKMQHLRENGYNLTRVKTLGMINMAGAQEAEERHSEFNHLDINGKNVSFRKEFNRLRREILRLAGKGK
jgi:8-oxo-dGTP pyrophosphatase MutT (NUDIX family)